MNSVEQQLIDIHNLTKDQKRLDDAFEKYNLQHDYGNLIKINGGYRKDQVYEGEFTYETLSQHQVRYRGRVLPQRRMTQAEVNDMFATEIFYMVSHNHDQNNTYGQ